MRRRRDDRAGVGEGRLDDPRGRAADRRVAALERRAAARREVRHDDRDRDERDGGAGDGDREPRETVRGSERVPEPHRRDDEPDLLLRQAGGPAATRERDEPVPVEEPERPEQERRRERDRVEVVEHEPLRRRVQEVGEREARGRPLRAEVPLAEQVDRHRAGRDGDGLGDEEERGVGPEPPERRERGDDRVEVRAEPRDLVAREVGHREEVAVRGRPDGLGEVADVEAAGPERAVLQHGERAEPGRERAPPPPTSRAGRVTRRERPLEQRPPARAEHLLGRARLVRRAAGRRRAAPRAPARRRRAGAPRRAPPGRPGGTSSASAPSVSSSRAAGVSAVITGRAQASAWKALFGITRAAFVAGAEDPERASRRRGRRRAAPRTSTHGTCATLAGRDSRRARLLAVPDDAERRSRARARRPRGSSRARGAGSACRRRARGTARAGASRAGRAARRRRRARPRRAPPASPNALAEERGVRLRVGDDEVGRAEGGLVDGAHDAGGGRARPEPPAVADERVVERDERVEDDRPPARDAPGGRQVEVPRVADDDDVRVVLASPGEVALRPQRRGQLAEADRPVVPPPDLPVPLDAPRRRRRAGTR